jgi:hypothetical protein
MKLILHETNTLNCQGMVICSLFSQRPHIITMENNEKNYCYTECISTLLRCSNPSSVMEGELATCYVLFSTLQINSLYNVSHTQQANATEKWFLLSTVFICSTSPKTRKCFQKFCKKHLTLTVPHHIKKYMEQQKVLSDGFSTEQRESNKTYIFLGWCTVYIK